MRELLGATPGAIIFVTLVLGGLGGLLTGQATARAWHGWRRLIPYVLLLTVACRFLHFALFDGDMAAPLGILLDIAWLSVATGIGWASTRATKMVQQYPWLYARAGPFGWRERTGR